MLCIFGRNWRRSELYWHMWCILTNSPRFAPKNCRTARGVTSVSSTFLLGEVWTFDMLADNALDIAHAAGNGQSLSWQASAGVVHPDRNEKVKTLKPVKKPTLA